MRCGRNKRATWIRRVLSLLGILSCCSRRPHSAVHALLLGGSASAPAAFRIVGLPSGGTQLLPASYVQSFVQWKIINDNKLVRATDGDSEASEGALRSKPTLNVLIKQGVAAYIMAGLELQHDLQSDTRSRLAQQWTTFAMVVEPNFRLLVYIGPSDGTDTQLVHVTALEVRQAVERVGLILSESVASTTTDLSEGFHIVSVPLRSDWTLLPADVAEGTDHMITSILTAEPDARELFTLEADVVEMTASSFLQIPWKDLLLSGASCSSSQAR